MNDPGDALVTATNRRFDLDCRLFSWGGSQMPTLAEDLNRIESTLLALKKEFVKKRNDASLDRLSKAINDAQRAFSGSWLGHHSRIYYKDFKAPPPGAHFSSEWGMNSAYGRGTKGEWVEYDGDEVYELLKAQAGSPSLSTLIRHADSLVDRASQPREELTSILDACLSHGEDAYLATMKKRVENARPRPVEHYLKPYEPKGQLFSRDTTAISNGIQTPPHFQVLAQVEAIKHRFQIPSTLADIAAHTALHLGRKLGVVQMKKKGGKKVFIGHGGSSLWRDLQDFLERKLNLEVDEFNRKPTAGKTTVERLTEMMEESAFAFLVMTAEDEKKGGTMHARENVIHEAGLFQGMLGFDKAIILLEDGCEEFSNIKGLTHISFPKGRIKAAFQEIRELLEHQKLVDG